MRPRLPHVLSATALVVAVLGTTPLGQAAGERLSAVVPFAKTAGNAQKLNGHRSDRSGAPGTIPVVGKNGKLPEAIGAVGPQGEQGPQGPQGEQGPAGVTGSAGGALTGTYPNPQIASNAVGGDQVTDDSLTGSDVKEATLGQVPSALLGGMGRTSVQKTCDPESLTFVICTDVHLDLPARSRVLVIARAVAEREFGASRGVGSCQIGTSVTGGLTDTNTIFEALRGTEGGGVLGTHAATLVTVTPPVGPGTVGFGINCDQSPLGGSGAGIEYINTSVTAVAISPS